MTHSQQDASREAAAWLRARVGEYALWLGAVLPLEASVLPETGS